MPEKIKKFGRRTFASLKIRNYRLYFTGQAISLCGTWMQTIAQSWLVLQLTDSGWVLGLVTALQFLPVLMLGPWGGVIADRFPKRTILYWTQFAAGLLALSLGILVATEIIRLWMVGVFALALGAVSAIDNPTRQTFISEMVEKEHLPNAVALNSTEVNLARVIGPAIGGVLIATIGLAWCFTINAFSYLAVLLALYMMCPDELYMSAAVRRAKGQLREGFRYVLKTPLLKDTLTMMAIIGTLSYEFNVTLPLLARFTFGGQAGSYAAMTSAMGAGSVLGALFVARRRNQSPRQFVLGALLLGVAMFLLAFAPTLTWALVFTALVGLLSINLLSLGNVLIQLESSAEMRGRVMALWTVAIVGSTAIGGPIVGLIGEQAGPRWAIATGGMAALIIALAELRKLRKTSLVVKKDY